MALAFLLDENIPGRLWRAIQRHNARGEDLLDVVRVGEPDELPLSSDDTTILAWAARAERILVTEDKHSIPGHLQEHLREGGHSPGVFLVGTGATIPPLIEFLVLVAHASEAREWRDRIEYVP